MTLISKKFLQISMALLMALGISLSAAQPAEAGRRDGRIAAGIILGAIGTAIIASEIRRSERRRRTKRRARHYNYNSDYRPRRASCYRGPRRCGRVGRRECWYNRYGERVCSKPRYKCWRERICD